MNEKYEKYGKKIQKKKIRNKKKRTKREKNQRASACISVPIPGRASRPDGKGRRCTPKNADKKIRRKR